MMNVNPDAIDHRVQHEVLEMRVAAELVDRVPALDASADRVDERVGREQTIGVDPEVRDCRTGGDGGAHLVTLRPRGPCRLARCLEAT